MKPITLEIKDSLFRVDYKQTDTGLLAYVTCLLKKSGEVLWQTEVGNHNHVVSIVPDGDQICVTFGDGIQLWLTVVTGSIAGSDWE
jgi:hypothetical protein